MAPSAPTTPLDFVQNLEVDIAEVEQEVNLRLFSFLDASGLVGDSLNVHFPPQHTSGGCNVDN